MATELPMYIVDAFADVPFSGNPAAVCLVSDPKNLTDEERQAIGAEMNLSETAFVELLQHGDSFEKSSHFSLRWFTPEVEINLCGHATLASAAVLFNMIGNSNSQLSFETRKSGILKTGREGNLIVMDFPQSTAKPVDRSSVSEVLKTLGCEELIEDVRYSQELEDLLVVLKPMPRSAFENLSPNPFKMKAIKGNYRALCITCEALDSRDKKGNPHDYLVRLFAPWVGINEDPVTGSSYTVTGPYWSEKLGKKSLYARQASKRGGDITVSIKDEDRVEISGEAITTLKGSIYV